MQTHLLPYFSFLASLSCAAFATEKAGSASVLQHQPVHSANPIRESRSNYQAPIMNVPPVQIPSENDGEDKSPGGALTISDILPKARIINIFASLTRDVSSVTSRLESNAPSENTTLLAPLNSAMQALPRKPWEDRPNDESGVSAARNEDKAAENLRKFVEEHVVTVSPWQESEKITTMGGGKIWWESRDSGKKRVVMPGEVEVDGVIGQVGNGEVWALKGAMNYI